MFLDETKNKIKSTCNEKYGVSYAFQSDTVKEKSKQTMRDRYGVDNAMQAEVIKEKAKQSMLNTYGHEYAAQVHDIRIKQQQRIQYDNIGFDSMYKVSFYKFLKDNNIQFEYQPKVSLNMNIII